MAKRFQLFFFVFSLATIARATEWRTLTDCHYLPNPANDGDSFHIQAGSKEYIFRLYFVDAPETEMSLPERVREQAKYFGLTVPQTLQVAKEALKFSREKLARPFVVRSCLEDARGRSRLLRYFAFIQVGDKDLAEELVANGLTRVYGAAFVPSGMNSTDAEWQKLRQLERKAKEEKIGGWGVSLARLTPRAERRDGADDFDAFFHSAKANFTPAPNSSPSVRIIRAPGAKLNVNQATIQELQTLPGIAPVLARSNHRGAPPQERR